jgi:O-antigen ligase
LKGVLSPPALPWRQHLERLGQGCTSLGLYLLAFGALYKVSWGNAALGFLLLAALAGLVTQPKAWRRQALVILLLGYWLALVVSSLQARHLYPHEVRLISKAGWAASYRGPLMIVLVAWAAHVARPKMAVLLALLAGGFALRILTRMDAVTWHGLLSGHARATFGNAATLFGLWCGGCLVGLAAHAPYLWHGQKLRHARVLLWLLGLVFFAAGLVASGARLAWLATAGVLLALAWSRRALGRKPSQTSQDQAGRLGIVVTALVLGMMALSQHASIALRLKESSQVIRQVITEGRLPDQGQSSLQVRLHLTAWALHHLGEHPVLGHGPGTMAPLLAQDGFKDEAGKPYRHVHNSYLQLALEQGVVALGLYAMLAVVVARALQRAAFTQPQHTTLAAGLILYALCALGDEVLASYHGGFVLALLAGLPCGATWERLSVQIGTTHA